MGFQAWVPLPAVEGTAAEVSQAYLDPRKGMKSASFLPPHTPPEEVEQPSALIRFMYIGRKELNQRFGPLRLGFPHL